MFVVDMEKGFRTSLIINIILFILFLTMTIMFFVKKPKCDVLPTPGLESMSIVEGKIDFKNDVYNYELDVSGISELNISVKAIDNKASINISGNSNFVVGKNIVIVSVKDSSNQVVQYVITVNKE